VLGEGYLVKSAKTTVVKGCEFHGDSQPFLVLKGIKEFTATDPGDHMF